MDKFFEGIAKILKFPLSLTSDEKIKTALNLVGKDAVEFGKNRNDAQIMIVLIICITLVICLAFYLLFLYFKK